MEIIMLQNIACDSSAARNLGYTQLCRNTLQVIFQ